MISASILASSWAFTGALPEETEPPADIQTALQQRPSLPLPSAQERPAAGSVVREINDPHTGDQWLLIGDPGRPGAPGRMILVATLATSTATPGRGTYTQPLPVIHAGDRLILEEDTAMVHARLQAVALSPALAGSALKVRLVLGGFVVRAVALGPGRAAFALEAETRP